LPRRFWRQGDLVFRRLEDNESGSQFGDKVKVLKVGSETGHPHTIRAKTILLSGSINLETGLTERLDQAFLEDTKPIEVSHEQHATLLLPEGRYVVRTVGLGRSRMFD